MSYSSVACSWRQLRHLAGFPGLVSWFCMGFHGKFPAYLPFGLLPQVRDSLHNALSSPCDLSWAGMSGFGRASAPASRTGSPAKSRSGGGGGLKSMPSNGAVSEGAGGAGGIPSGFNAGAEFASIGLAAALGATSDVDFGGGDAGGGSGGAGGQVLEGDRFTHAGEVRLEEVRLAERIGQGGSSTVYRVRRMLLCSNESARQRWAAEIFKEPPSRSERAQTHFGRHLQLCDPIKSVPNMHARTADLMAFGGRFTCFQSDKACLPSQGAWRGVICAVKYMICDTGDAAALRRATREIVLSKRMSHPHVVRHVVEVVARIVQSVRASSAAQCGRSSCLGSCATRMWCAAAVHSEGR